MNEDTNEQEEVVPDTPAKVNVSKGISVTALTTSKAFLQRRVMLLLGEAPAQSVTALAEKAGASRPSVSRVLHNLEEEGLASNDEETGWTLTEKGKAELKLVTEELYEQMLKSVNSMTESLSQSIDVQKLVGNISSTVLPQNVVLNQPLMETLQKMSSYVIGLNESSYNTWASKVLENVINNTGAMDTMSKLGAKILEDSSARSRDLFDNITKPMLDNISKFNEGIALSAAKLTPAITPDLPKTWGTAFNVAEKFNSVVAPTKPFTVIPDLVSKTKPVTVIPDLVSKEKLQQLSPAMVPEPLQILPPQAVKSTPAASFGTFIRIGAKRINMAKVNYFEAPQEDQVVIYFENGSALTLEGDEAAQALLALES